MKRALSLSAPLVLAFALALAAHADAPVSHEPRTVAAFHAIELAGTLEVDVTIGKPARVEVSGEADLLDKVSTTVKDGVLVLDTKPRMRSHRHLRASIVVPDLRSITISGTGEMTVAGIANDSLAISLPGTGAITATGSTGALHVVVDGTGDVAAKGLTAKDATVEVNGTGQATLHATQSVEAKVTGTGSIDIVGNPTRVKKSVTGLGSINIR
jgi:hypothetical protein